MPAYVTAGIKLIDWLLKNADVSYTSFELHFNEKLTKIIFKN